MESHQQSIPELPSLEQGVTLLESTAPGPLQLLVIHHALMNRTSVAWIDTGGYAQTEPLVELAPSPRVLKRIQVARAFTAYQHHTLCNRLTAPDGQGATRGLGDDEIGLIVVPAVDGLYRDEDVTDFDGQELLVHALAQLAAAARHHECPVLVSRLRDDEFSAPVARLASDTLECESTPQGPRFVGEEFETLVYPLGDGWLQTTLAFWNQVLEKRTAVHPTPITAETIREVA